MPAAPAAPARNAEAQPPVTPALRTREAVENTDITALSAAYETMQKRSEDDNRSWTYWSEYHGYNRFDCWHHGAQGKHNFPYDLFLPWHRAYLVYFEQVAFAKSPAVSLPWWDWTSDLSHREGIPDAFANGPESLRSGPVPPGLREDPPRTTRNPQNGNELPTVEEVEGTGGKGGLLGIESFTEFSRELQNVHDGVHGWVRGDMGVVATSAFDPIFWSHHAMIDRIWYLWQLRQGVANIPPEYLSLVLPPWNLTVEGVLSVSILGYTYGVSRTLQPISGFQSTELKAS
jgi:tyrosinase